MNVSQSYQLNNDSKSRTEYSARNTSVAMFARIIAILMGFFTRVVFTHTLSEDYVGVNGLFTDILNVLALSELGIGTAITYALYDRTSGGRRDGSMMRSQYASSDQETFVDLTFSYRDEQYRIRRNPEYQRAGKRKKADGSITLVKEASSVELTLPDGSVFRGKKYKYDPHGNEQYPGHGDLRAVGTGSGNGRSFDCKI